MSYSTRLISTRSSSKSAYAARVSPSNNWLTAPVFTMDRQCQPDGARSDLDRHLDGSMAERRRELEQPSSRRCGGWMTPRLQIGASVPRLAASDALGRPAALGTAFFNAKIGILNDTP